MASSSSSSSPRTWIYNVFTSFHGPDVRQTFLSHLRKQFKLNGIEMFDDTNEIERSHIIGSALRKAIRESRIFIVVLSKNYASSSWCLDELLEILKCNENGQRVMTVFHGVDPSDVRKQIGDFGVAFNKTCASRTKEEKRKWSQALKYVADIAGEHFKNSTNEADMIEKIARDVSDKLKVIPSRDFDGMVGLEAHLRKVKSLLDLDYDGVKIVGISGPAGIGKSTIARDLRSQLSNRFPFSCFMDNHNLKEINLVEYGSKLRLQKQLLSDILNQDGIKVDSLDVMKQRLHDKKVLIILDDVEHLEQLKVLANVMWFGPGSRVIVITENKEVLQQHGIDDIYHVGFPSGDEALKIFCLSAFRQTYPPDGFTELADEVVRICSKLPLGLNVLGSSLRGKTHAAWKDELPRLKKSCLGGGIEKVLKVGYESLDEEDQSLFLFIAVFFNYKHVDHVTSMLAKTNLDVILGLKKLTNRCLVHYENSKVVMHHLLQVMARQVISKQETWKRQILVDAKEIFYVLENAKGNGSIVGISFDITEINELKISTMAFEKMHNLIFLDVYNRLWSTKRQLHISEEMEFLPRLSLLRWMAYPGKSLPFRFCPENLIELDMPNSKLEKLWEGTKPLANLKKINLSGSSRLKELPDLSNATNLESLDVCSCIALVELPSSISNLIKLKALLMNFCESLEVIPSLINLACIDISMLRCFRLRSFPDLPTKIRKLCVGGTALEALPASLTYCSRLEDVDLSCNGNLKAFLTELPTSVTRLKLSNSGIERITDSIKGLPNLCILDISNNKSLVSLPELPTSVSYLYLGKIGIERIPDSIKGLHNLQTLDISGCKRLVSLPELPCSLKDLYAKDCESLEKVSGPFNTPNAKLNFSNCAKLDRQAQQAIIQQSFGGGFGHFPGKEVPAKFNHRAKGNSLTIPYSGFDRIKVCVVMPPHHQGTDDVMRYLSCSCRLAIGDTLVDYTGRDINLTGLKREHLCIFHMDLKFRYRCRSEVRRKIVLKFSTRYSEVPIWISMEEGSRIQHQIWDKNSEIIECGVQILKDETNRNNNGDEDNCSVIAHKSDKEEDDNDTIANGRSESESGKVSDKEPTRVGLVVLEEKKKLIQYGTRSSIPELATGELKWWHRRAPEISRTHLVGTGNSGLFKKKKKKKKVSDKEDDEEEYKSEHGEASKYKVDDIADEEDEYQSDQIWTDKTNRSNNLEIIECGVEILTDETNRNNNGVGLQLLLMEDLNLNLKWGIQRRRSFCAKQV